MATELILPRVDMEMTEGKIARWYVKNGDAVKKGQVVFEIETDKATMEIESPDDGVVQGIDGEIGVTMPVGRIVGWILRDGETPPRTEEATNASAVPAPSLLRATPLARSAARDQAIDLRTINGSGPGGRIVARDLPAPERHAALSASPSSSSSSERLNLEWFSERAGVPVILLHGFGTSLKSWRALAVELKSLGVAGIDLPNHGRSPRIATPDLGSLATLVLSRIDDERVDAMHLVGHSMGAGAALALAARLGPRLKSLTLIAPVSMGPEFNGPFVHGLLRANREQSLRPWLGQLFGDPSRLTGSFAATAWAELESPERRAALAEMADRLLPDGTQAETQRALLDRIAAPVKVIWGTLDRIVPYHQSAGLPPMVALHSLAGVGHLPHVEAAATVAALVRQQVAAGTADVR